MAKEEKDPKGQGEEVQRWTAKRRAALVTSLIRNETSIQEAARKHGLTVAEIERWKERALDAMENALRSRPKDEEALKDEQIRRLKQKIGELVLESDVLKEAVKPYLPFDRGTSDE
jgi:transposase-like protein